MSPATLPDAGPDTGSGTIDLFLSYNSSERQSIQIFSELLKARRISTFLDRESLRPGLPWFDALQDVLSKAGAVAIFIGKAGLGTWQKREMALALDRQARQEKDKRDFPVIPILLPGADLDEVPGFLLLNTWIDLRTEIGDASAADALVQRIRKQTALPETASKPVPCPYRALRAFREEDAPLFFGRETLSNELLKKISDTRLVAVVGPSGSGKSSLVQAGLMPLLRRQHWPDPTWDMFIFTPGKRPFHKLATALVPIWEGDKIKQIVAAEELGNCLQKSGSLDLSIGQALAASSGTQRLLIVVDQFEELFTLTLEPERQLFLKALLEAPESLPVTIILTLRADFFGQAINASRGLSDGMQKGLITLGPMTRSELRRAIEGPSQAVGVKFEDGLVDRILDHIENQPGNLPLLEFALTELWGKERLQTALLTNQQYDEIGGVEQAISQRADAHLHRLSPEQQEVAARIFTRLVRVAAGHEEGADTRQPVRLSDLGASAQAIVQSFIAARLLVVTYNKMNNEEAVEVAHETLIRHWRHLREWVNQDREFLLWRQALNVRITEWERTKRDVGSLLHGASLDEARHLIKQREKDLNDAERRFIEESARVNDLESRRPRRMLAAAASFLVLIALAIAGWRFYTQSDAYQMRTLLSNAPGLLSVSGQSADTRYLLTLVLARRENEALVAADKITGPSDRSYSLAAVAVALAQMGREDEARRAVDQAMQTSESIADSAERCFVLAKIAVALSQTGRGDEAKKTFDKAIKTSDQIEMDYFRPQTLARVAMTMAQSGSLDDALVAVNKIPEQRDRATLLAQIGVTLGQAGRSDEAKQAVDKALTAANKTALQTDRATALAKVAITLAQMERLGEAKQVVDKALSTAVRATDLYSQSSAFSQVAIAFVYVQNTDNALAAFSRIKENYDQEYALPYITLALAEAGKLNEALAAADRVAQGKTVLSNYSPLVTVVSALAQSGRLDDAQTAAERISKQEDLSFALAEVALELARAGRVDEARTLVDRSLVAADKITMSNDQSSVLAQLARTLARLRLFKRAREVAERCYVPNDKLEAYGMILFEYIPNRDPNLVKLLEAEVSRDLLQ